MYPRMIKAGLVASRAAPRIANTNANHTLDFSFVVKWNSEHGLELVHWTKEKKPSILGCTWIVITKKC